MLLACLIKLCCVVLVWLQCCSLWPNHTLVGELSLVRLVFGSWGAACSARSPHTCRAVRNEHCIYPVCCVLSVLCSAGWYPGSETRNHGNCPARDVVLCLIERIDCLYAFSSCATCLCTLQQQPPLHISCSSTSLVRFILFEVYVFACSSYDLRP